MANIATAPVSPDEIPWAKCLMGCALRAGGEINFLPCLHVLCSNACLDKCTAEIEKKESKLHCRKCLRKFTLDQIKRKVKLELFFEKKTKLEEIALKCGSCIMDDPVASYCSQCQVNLCIACTEFHPRLRGKHDHQLDRDLEKRRLIELELQKKSRNQCETHGKKDTHHYCYTCQLKMCNDCKPGHDKSHTVVNVAEEMNAIRARINSTKEVQGILNLGISKLEDKLISLKDAEWKEFVSSLDSLMLRVLEMLHQRREALLVDGRKKHVMKVKDIENKIKVLNRAKHDSAALLKVFNEFCDKLELDDIGMINVARTVLPHTDSLNRVKEMLQENFDEFVEKDRSVVINDGNFSDLQKLFPQLASVELGNMPVTSIPGPSSAEVNHVGGSTTPSTEISSSKESGEEFVTPNQGVNRPRRIAVKSTSGRLNGRPLGMPHLNERYPIPPVSSHTNGLPLPTPPVLSRATPPIRTYLSPNQKAVYSHSAKQDSGSGSQLLNQRKRNSSGKRDQTPPLSPRSNKRLSTSGKKESEEPPSLSGTQEKLSLRTRKKEEKDDMKGNDANGPKLKANGNSNVKDAARNDLVVWEPPKASETGSNASEDEQMDVDSDESHKKSDGNCSDSNATEIISAPSPSEEKDNGLEPKDDEMPVLSQSDTDPTEEKGDDELPKITISQQILSPSASSTSTLSESSAHTFNRSRGVRKGERARRQKVFKDCIDPETMRLPKKNDLIADDPSRPRSASVGKRRRLSTKDDALKRARLRNQDETDSDDDTSNSKVTSTDSYRSASETGSENGFGEESGSESNFGGVTCRRLSLRNRQKENAGGGSASRRTSTNPTAESPAFLDAPVDSLDNMPGWCDYPIQGKCDAMKKSDDDDNDDYCGICLDGGEDIIVCCDFCPKVFHLKCHIPILQGVPDDNDEKWRCNYDKPKEMIMEEIQNMPDIPDAEEKALTDANPRQFTLACKFMMEVYKIPEIPTMKWVFPEEYFKEFKKAPYHLKFLREKLCLPVEKDQQPFSSVKEYMLAFRQMFLQAFRIYLKMSKNRKPAVNCLRKFQQLVKDYYPEYEDIFENILRER